MRVLGLAAAAVLLTELLKFSAALRARPFAGAFSDEGTLPLARELFGRFAFQFELLSLVILACVVAAVALAAARRPAQ
jgi:NADH:ubiquinone oxidoreductase subunit 6 (subunit J)